MLTDDDFVGPFDWSKLFGRHAVVGLTFVDDDSVVNQEQLHGDLVRVEDHVLILKLSDGREYGLPLDPRAIELAPPGLYRFRSTGEVVENPDLMITFTIYASKQRSD